MVRELIVMNTGAVALIDSLGFRGIWGRYKAEDVLSALRGLKTRMEVGIEKQFSSQPWMRCNSAFLSDTIAISMSLEQPTPSREAMSVLYLADVISWALEWTLRSAVPLAFRGAIALGSYEIDTNFLIGQAIDDAAAAHELAQAAIIFFTPAARDHVARWLQDQPRNTHLVEFDVPLSGGDTFGTYTVSPLEQARDQADADKLTRNLLATFSSDRMDVAIKRQNTVRHMRACYSWRNFVFPADVSTQ
jgi:hypothetical protein